MKKTVSLKKFKAYVKQDKKDDMKMIKKAIKAKRK
jgi:hypothetical protein